MQANQAQLENGAAGIDGCGSELSVLCRKFRVELQRAMNREAQHRTIVSRVTLYVAASGFVTLLAGGHIVLHYVTIIILHNAEKCIGISRERTICIITISTVVFYYI